MRYRFMLRDTAYKVMRASDAFAPQIYRAVSLTLMLKMPDGTPLKGQTININGTDEKYVGVTPGETYTIYGRNVADSATIEWSDEINTHAVDVTI